MNIHFQISGLIITLYMLFLYRSHKILGLYGERVFLSILTFTISSLTLDALSVVAIHYRARLPELLVKLNCKAYIITLIWLGMFYFCYVMLDLRTNDRQHRRMLLILSAFSTLASLLSALLPIAIYDDGRNVYTAGPSVITVYTATLLYILSAMYGAFYIRRHQNSRRGLAVILATTLWLLAAIVQMLKNELLVVGFACSVGVMILYIVLENPDAHLDRQLGCFNSYALNRYLAMLMAKREPFHVLDVSIRNIRALEDRGIDVQAMTREIIRKIEKDSQLYLFKNFSYDLVLISRDPKKVEALSDQLMPLISSHGDVSRNLLVLLMKDAQQLESADELFRFLTYIREENVDQMSSIVSVSDGMIREYRTRLLVEKEISAALAEDRVEVYLQPVFGQKGETYLSAEALVRIRNEDGSVLSPGAFIPVAEKTGQVTELGERVLEKVCAFLRDSDAVSLGLQSVEVNLSAVQCDDNTTAARLSRIVEGFGVAPERIIFEITETAVSVMKESLLENMRTLVSMGYRFALDDFGKGESNLNYIVELPVDMLKLDMDMTKGYFSNEKARCVIHCVVDMARQLDFKVVVEGVETREEAEGIRQEGIDYIQGYFYSRPLPMPDFLEFLRTNAFRGEAADSDGVAADRRARLEHLFGKRILLAEDNELSMEITVGMLQKLGIRVDTAVNGMQAVNRVRDGGPGMYDMVLMDIRMPVMDGCEAARRIRTMGDQRLAEMPIVALTTYATGESRERAIASGMNDCLQKPLAPDQLWSVMNRLVKQE